MDSVIQRSINQLKTLLRRFQELGIGEQIDYEKFYLYSIITHSTAIEGSTVTEVENQLLFDEGISPLGKPLVEQLMNLDLKAAYERCRILANEGIEISEGLLCGLSALVMKNTGSQYNTLQGSFDSSRGDLRLLNVSADFGGRSYMSFLKIPQKLAEFCEWINMERKNVAKDDVFAAYEMSFRAHFRLVTIHPWADGNGLMSRLVMNMLQWERGLIPTIVYKEHKAAYIEALVRARKEEDEDIFCQFMFGELQAYLAQSIADFERSQDEDVPVKVTNVPVNVPVNLTQRQRAIIMEMLSNGNITIRELAEKLHVNEKTIKRDISVLRSHGVVRREGADKNGHWVVIKE